MNIIMKDDVYNTTQHKHQHTVLYHHEDTYQYNDHISLLKLRLMQILTHSLKLCTAVQFSIPALKQKEKDPCRAGVSGVTLGFSLS